VFNSTGPPAEEDDVGPDEGRAQHPPTTITPPGGNTNPATTPATTPAPAPATLLTTTNVTQFPATIPAAPMAITPSTTQPEESEVQVLSTRQRAIAFNPTLEQQHGIGNRPLNGQQQRVGNGPFNIKTTLEDTPEYTIVRSTGPVREQIIRSKITPIATWQENQDGTVIHLEQWDTSRLA
jgi:hypothetical protein